MSWTQFGNTSARVVHRGSIAIADGWTVLSIEGYRSVAHVADSRTRPGVELDVWYERDLNSTEVEEVGFSVHGTGHVFHALGSHVGTVLTHGGELVWHVYAHTMGVIRP